MPPLSFADRLQLVPMLPVALMLTAGIATARAATLPPALWLAAAVVTVTTAAALTIAGGRYAKRCGDSRLMPTTASVAVLAATFFTGAFLMSESLGRRVTLHEGRAEYTAVIVSQPREYRRSIGCDIEVMSINGRECYRPVRLRAYFSKDPDAARLAVGDGLRAFSWLHEPDMFTRGVAATTFIPAYAYRGEAVSMLKLSVLTRAKIRVLRLRRRLTAEYAAADIGGQRLAVLAALTLGDKSMLHRETRDDYARAGVSHILALSGMHLTIIYVLLSLLLDRRRNNAPDGRTLMTQLFIIVSLWFFVALVGMPPAAVRAATMMTLFAFCRLMEGDTTTVNTLAFTATAMLVADPESLFDIGFQLSFMAMLAIAVVFRPLCSVVPQALMSIAPLRWLIQTSVVSLAAQMGTAPIVAYYFGIIPMWTLLTNIVVAVFATALLYGAALFLILTPLTALPPLAAAHTATASLLSAVAGAMNSTVQWMATLPGATLTVHPTLLQVVLTYCAIAAACCLGALIIDTIVSHSSRHN